MRRRERRHPESDPAWSDFSEENSTFRFDRRPFGRRPGPKRFEDEEVFPDIFEDETGMPHSLREYDAGDSWSPDPRSEGHGPHFGKGPKGYRRSDERIREEVFELLREADELDASDISIEVEDGVATLSGAVENRRSKRLAEELLDDVLGLWDVRNELRVRKNLSSWVPGLGSVEPQSDDHEESPVYRALRE
jgi:hypothetical protein